MLNQLQAMRVFLKIAELSSFSRAAASLDLSNGAVTRYVTLLEAHLNTRLINRTTRSVSLTEAGRSYAQGCREMMDLLNSIESTIGRETGEPGGTLKVACAASFAHVALPPLVMHYRERYQKVDVDLTLLHGTVDLIEDGFDVGLLTSRQLGPHPVTRKPVATLYPVVVATPSYLRDFGEPERPAALGAREVLAPSREIHGRQWCFVNSRGEEETIRLGASCTANDPIMLRQLALGHMGIAILPSAYVSSDIENGRLVPVLRDYAIRGGDEDLVLAWSGRRPVAAKVRCFVELALSYFQTDFAAAIGGGINGGTGGGTGSDSAVDGLPARLRA
jgi:DNA-binding transcriptional LysR family regulator